MITDTETRPANADKKPAAPAISLPKGGGAIRGIGEKFDANPVTGTGAMTVPIATSPGRSGFGPQLSLSYDSGSGNGPFGFGWNLSVPAISRKTDKGLPQYRDAGESDVYVLSGTEDLVPVLNADGKRFEDDTTVPGYVIHRYRPRIEGPFARIERWTNAQTHEIHWRSISRDNITTLYGTSNACRVFDPADPDPAHPTRIFSWLIAESYDDRGNASVYEYAAENDDNVDRARASERNRVRTANRYLKRIKYGNRVSRLIEPDLAQASWMFEVVFDYGEGHYEEVDLDPAVPEGKQHRYVRASASASTHWEVRPDPFSSYRAGFEVRTSRRCRRVLMFHHIPDLPGGEKGYDGLVRSTEFDYADLDIGNPVSIDAELAHQGSTRFASFLRTITQSGYVRDDSRPPVVRNGVELATYLKKSLPPLEFEYSKPEIHDRVIELEGESLENLPNLDGTTYQWVDLDGEGIPGILTEQAGAWFYKPNLGDGRFGALQAMPARPSVAGVREGEQQLLDLAGDGQLDLVAFGRPAPGFYERTAEEGWETFRALHQIPNIPWHESNVRFIDLNGDGHADVLITEQDVFTWHPSLAEEGFGPARSVRQAIDEEHGPRLVAADGRQSIFLADMCGDGLTDLVRVRNGEVCYWPNLGYGRFGAKVTMDNAPWFEHPDQFEQERLRLADIDGSGTTDIIYLGRYGARLYFNQSGNRLSEARPLNRFPLTDDVRAVTTADVLGNGTVCLVWSSRLPADARRRLCYVDLMGGTKPHLLIRSINNLGAETEVVYASSTRFYLESKRSGRPWATRLPFPVHVVERVITYDRVSGNRFVTRYAYHHGYFDGVDREFRGFGLVEQWDTEEFAAFDIDGQMPDATNIEASSHVPPVLTKTWFHVGAYLGREHISDYFAGLLDATDTGEYYREPGLSDAAARALLLDDTVLPGGLTVEEEREACRALKGSMLRQEVYGLDGTDAQQHPYVTTEQNFTIRVLQHRGGNRHAVVLAHARESISYDYERNPADPRVNHALTLEVDDFGNVLESAEIAYGRRQADTSLDQADQGRQTRIFATCAAHSVTNPVDTTDDYRTPLPCESRSYELTGVALPAGRRRFSFEEVRGAVSAAAARDYEIGPTAGFEKRLIEHERRYYRRDDLDGELLLGDLQSLALPSRSYRLAFTPGLAAAVYGGKADDAMLEKEACYAHTKDDAGWWMPSGQVSYSPDPNDKPLAELAYARTHFFLPQRYRDPFHTGAVSTESFVTYDRYDLMMEETRDACGNRVTAGERNIDPAQPPVRVHHDYRVLQPALVMDPNRNRTALCFDALGMVAGTAVMGKPEEAPVPGDRLTAAFRADLTQSEIDEFVANPKGPAAASLLADATTRFIYDLDAYRRAPDRKKKRTAFAATLARESHAGEPLPAGGLRIQTSFSYSDGFGHEIQKKIQAEPGPVPERDDDGRIIVGADGLPQMTAKEVSPRWVGSGWTVNNNKGQPVRQYEPFFTDLHGFEFDVRIGVSPVLFHDPVGRVVATLHPDHTWEKVVFDSWRHESWDVNDTVLLDPKSDPDVGGFFRRLPEDEYLPTWHALRTDPAQAQAASQRWPDSNVHAAEQCAAEKAAIHGGTPTVAHADSLGRTFLTVAHNRFKYSDSPDADQPVETFDCVRVILDIEGNERELTDANNRVVMRYEYDMLGNRIRQSSMEAGARWTLLDVAGNSLYTWDDRGYRLRTAYDPLRRPTDCFLQQDAGTEMVAGRTVYGEGRPDAEAHNLRGKVSEVFDQAGVVTSEEYDFKGNLLRGRRQFAASYKATVDWSAPVPLEPEVYSNRVRYDALNRPIQIVAPHANAPGAKVNLVQHGYNEANLLERVHAWLGRDDEPDELLDPATATLPAVTNIDYDAKGQRQRIDYGNDTSTAYAYDRLTSRLTHMLTSRSAAVFPDDCPQPPPAGWPGSYVQNLHYTRDPAGNITYVRDDAQQAIFFCNRRVEPSAEYTYDATYRLIEATGREHLGQIGGAPVPHTHDDVLRTGIPWSANDGNAMGAYMERYIYDAVGNILEMQHRGSDPAHPGWTRTYSYEEPSLIEQTVRNNRLSRTEIAGNIPIVERYTYDVHGNIVRMPHLGGADPAPNMHWDFRDQLRQVDLGGGGTVYYVYDSDGQRVRKVWEKGPNLTEERRYLGGVEIYRRQQGTERLERETLDISDDGQRVVLVETRTLDTAGDDPAPAQLVRYQFSNHLGSSSLELDDRAQIITYEEYTPYGSTSYQAVRSNTETPKRFRYTGRERDEETGFYYHGARYYAPWIGRWTACDPAGLEGGHNLYAYGADSPACFTDPAGTVPKKYEDQRGKDTAAKTREMKKNLAEAKKKGYKPDPMQKRAERMAKKRGKTPIEQHHNIGVKQAADVKMNPKRMGRDMSSLWATKSDPTVKAGISDKAEAVWDRNFKGKKRTHHNVGKALNFDEQAKGPKTAKGLEDAAKASKERLPATADLTERAKMDWTRSTPKGPAVDPKTGRVISKESKLVVKETKLVSAGVETLEATTKGARAALKLGRAARFFAAAIPFAGVLVGQASAAHAATQGDYTGAALDEAGFIPVAGDALDAARGGYALGEAANEILPLEQTAMKAGEAAEKAAKYLGAGEDTARVIGGIGAAAGAIGEFLLWTNPVTAPYKVVSAFL